MGWFSKDPMAEKRRRLKKLVAQSPVLRVALGVGPDDQPDWIPTDIDTLNVTRAADWRAIFGSRRIDVLMAEHVWEHLSPDDAATANHLCFELLKPRGRLRLAVPDGFHPDPAYREHVRPGGCGPGADDHKVLYDYKRLPAELRQAGFAVDLLEYWDENGQFHFLDWASELGHIRRSKRFDPRNQDGSLRYTSLIVDAIKP